MPNTMPRSSWLSYLTASMKTWTASRINLTQRQLTLTEDWMRSVVSFFFFYLPLWLRTYFSVHFIHICALHVDAGGCRRGMAEAQDEKWFIYSGPLPRPVQVQARVPHVLQGNSKIGTFFFSHAFPVLFTDMYILPHQVSITFDPFLYLPVPLPQKQKVLSVYYFAKEPHKKPIKASLALIKRISFASVTGCVSRNAQTLCLLIFQMHLSVFSERE